MLLSRRPLVKCGKQVGAIVEPTRAATGQHYRALQQHYRALQGNRPSWHKGARAPRHPQRCSDRARDCTICPFPTGSIVLSKYSHFLLLANPCCHRISLSNSLGTFTGPHLDLKGIFSKQKLKPEWLYTVLTWPLQTRMFRQGQWERLFAFELGWDRIQIWYVWKAF